MGTYKAFPLEGKVGPKDPDEGEPATGSGRLAPPRSARILKGSVVNICLSHHRGFIIGERLKEKSGEREKALPLEGRVETPRW